MPQSTTTEGRGQGMIKLDPLRSLKGRGQLIKRAGASKDPPWRGYNRRVPVYRPQIDRKLVAFILLSRFHSLQFANLAKK